MAHPVNKEPFIGARDIVVQNIGQNRGLDCSALVTISDEGWADNFGSCSPIIDSWTRVTSSLFIIQMERKYDGSCMYRGLHAALKYHVAKEAKEQEIIVYGFLKKIYLILQNIYIMVSFLIILILIPSFVIFWRFNLQEDITDYSFMERVFFIFKNLHVIISIGFILFMILLFICVQLFTGFPFEYIDAKGVFVNYLDKRR